VFFDRAGPFALRDIAEKIDAVLMHDEEGSRMIADVKSLRNAGSDNLAFLDNRKYAAPLLATKAGACILTSSMRSERQEPWRHCDNRRALQCLRSSASLVLLGRCVQQGGRYIVDYLHL
jgi:UDP-3-O-[3-hydroxymyristoyl] glucosamine N-acyltransferase